jgi:hypothetical protein
MKKFRLPLIHSARGDGFFILAPPFLVLIVLFLLPDSLLAGDNIPGWAWLILIVGIDVSHVYSTLYRSYFNPEEFAKHRKVMILIPLLVLGLGVFLYSLGDMVFWRCLAYLAVFHFIRQQYGFMRLYSRMEVNSKLIRTIEAIIVYSAAVYPVIFWHFSDDRQFHWFVDNDFFQFSSSLWPERIAFIIYLIGICTWFYLMIKEQITIGLNLPKHLLIAGTYLSWYFGIVYFNGDFTFTALNVISHGIPYMALVWFMNRRDSVKPTLSGKWWIKSMLWFVLVLGVLAFAEEALWDSLHWRDHTEMFGWFYFIPRITSKDFLSIVVPLLAVPQMTHYVLDGFIWKVRKMG